jgi:cytochrome c-type biogenesis protein CcmH/NrfF
VSVTAPHDRWWGSRAAWLVLVIVAVAVLAIGSIHNTSGTAAREAQLDSLIKCPACEDLSIAQSDAPSAVALRHRVSTFVLQGWSDARVEAWITGRYGSDALLVPPTSGASETLYVVPVAAVGIAAAGLGWYLWRRRPGSGRDDVPEGASV